MAAEYFLNPILKYQANNKLKKGKTNISSILYLTKKIPRNRADVMA